VSGWKVNPVNVTIGSVKIGGVSPAKPARDASADRSALAQIQDRLQARDFPAAAALAHAALERGLEHPMVLSLAAVKLEDDGRLEEALKVLGRALELTPGDPGASNARGLILLRLEEPRAAMAEFDAAVRAAPDFPGAHCGRGSALEALGRLNEAQGAYERALELQPQNLAALAGLANLASRRGDHGEARRLAQAVLDAEPNYPDAVMALAAADAAEGSAERARQRLEMLAADARLTGQQRALAHGLLGDVLDSQQLTEEAFQAYAACNMGLWRAYADAYSGGPSALDFARAMVDVLQTIPAQAWAASAAAQGGARKHVFLLGFPRSGTTLLEQVLAGHPDVAALEERETLVDAQRAFLASPGDLERLAAAGEAELAPLRQAYWDRVRAEGGSPDGKVFVDKHPLNTFRLPLILKLFPDAVILFAQRDPRDVVLSCYRRRFAMSASAYQLLTLPGAAGYYDAAMRIAQTLEPAMAEKTLVVRHEALVADFETVVRGVCERLGLSWNEDLRRFADRAKDRAVATPSGAQLAVGLSAEGVGAWRRYADQLVTVQAVLQPWIQKFGYDPA
jgi:tetratricopeptide (TPR) repeat protein